MSFNTGDEITVTDDKDFDKYIKWCAKHGVSGIVPAPFGNGITFEGDIQSVEKMEKLLYHPEGITTAIKRKPDHWGKTIRQPYPITPSAQEKQDYQILVDDLKKILLDIGTNRRKDLSKGIAAMMRMRQKAGLIKAGHIAEYAKYCVEDLEEQIVITTVFHNTAEVIAEKLDKLGIESVTITGKDNAQDKESKRLAFQQGNAPVAITSITTGISLHSNEESIKGSTTARRMIIADVHFSPVEHTQLEGRINRNGQSGIIVIPMLADTIDEKVVSRLLAGINTQSILQSHGDENDIAFIADTFGVKI